MSVNKQSTQSDHSAQIYNSQPESNYQPSVSNEQANPKRVRWTPEQNIRYAQFLKDNMETFQTAQLRKKHKVFSKLSKFMAKRSTSQAKSHHQKMMKRHKQVNNIILFIESKFVNPLGRQGKRRKKRNVKKVRQQVAHVVQQNAMRVEVQFIINHYLQEAQYLNLQESSWRVSQQEWFKDP